MKTRHKILYFSFLLMLSLLCSVGSCKKDKKDTGNKITDSDGNEYTTVTIGTQAWLVENLKTTKYQNGDQIPSDLNTALSTSAACKINPGEYGNFYNAYAVNESRKICPLGWHVPSSSEWEILIFFLGGQVYAGGKMKEAGTLHWLSPNVGATNESGFTALPAGVLSGPDITDSGHGTYFWSSTETDDHSSNYAYLLTYVNEDISRNTGMKIAGFSVRCMK